MSQSLPVIINATSDFQIGASRGRASSRKFATGRTQIDSSQPDRYDGQKGEGQKGALVARVKPVTMPRKHAVRISTKSRNSTELLYYQLGIVLKLALWKVPHRYRCYVWTIDGRLGSVDSSPDQIKRESVFPPS
jgi:hypothetical protein